MGGRSRIMKRWLYISHLPLARLIAWVDVQLHKQRLRLALSRRGIFASSSMLSLAFRPLLERDLSKSLLAAPMMASLMAGGVVMLPETDYALASWDIQQPVSEMLTYEVGTPTASETAEAIQLPVGSLLGISQYYHAGHGGVDLRAPYGSLVRSMASGRVELVEYSRFGYGRRVIVTHDDELKSMYAHLDEVSVEVGELVAAGEMIGTVGMTGWTTGPHLHFETFKQGAVMNPLRYIGPAIENYQTQLLAAGD